MGEYYWTVYGSHGEIEIDRDGSVILCKPQFDELGVESEYNEIGRIDLTEEQQAMPKGFVFDILDVGYWTWGGEYEPPRSGLARFQGARGGCRSPAGRYVEDAGGQAALIR
jgi:hypothetical protein